MQSTTPSGQVVLSKGRRLDSHQHDPVYKTGAFLIEPRRRTRGVRGELNPPLRLSQSRVQNHYTTNTIRRRDKNESVWPDSNRRSRAPKARGFPSFPTHREKQPCKFRKRW